jgi:Mg-chelatase subunit ChlD
MQFLAPLFFVALAGLAIPVLLHLTQREKKQIVRFPSLMFVRRIPYQSVRRRKLHNLLLLALRLAALALIILAFARPLIRGNDPQQAAGTGARELVVLVDTSYSMGFADRWERARAAAHAAIDGISAGDRASLVFFASGAEIALRSTPERERLRAAVAAAKPSAGSTRYAPALKVAGSILSESTLPRREVVLISDFQRTGWRGEEGARLPTGTVLTPVSIQGGDGGNVSVTAVSLARSSFSNQERVTVTAGLINRTDRPVAATTVALQVAGLPIATKPLMVEPGGSTSVTFDAFTVSDRNMRGTVRVGDDALAADNTFNFVVSPATPLRLTLVERGGPGSLFLSRALTIGESPKFETTTRPADAVSEDDLRRSAVVVLNDVAVPAALARRLARFVEQGGGLLVITGARASWPQDVDVLPGSIGNPVDRTRGTAARIGALEFGHPVLEPFRAPRSGNFSTSRVYGYRNVTKVAAAQVLAAFDSGAPAVLERRVGTGRVMMWASSVDNVWNDLPVKGVFLPFVHQTVRHLAAYREPRPWLTVGQVLDADTTIGPQGQDAQRILLSPSGKRLPMDDEGSEVTELTEQGFYELRTADKDVAVVAANVDPAEADLSPMDPKEISVATVGSPDSGGAAGPGVPLTPEAQERNQRLWWYLLLAGVALLGAETVLSNRLAKT